MLTMDSCTFDPTVLDAITPADVSMYLSGTGWVLQRRTGTSCIYRQGSVSSWDEVTVPDAVSYSDYRAMVSLILGTLSRVESRTEAEIASDIMAGNVNGSVRYRLLYDGVPVPAPLDWVMQVVGAHKGMTVAVYEDLRKSHRCYGSLLTGCDAADGLVVGQAPCDGSVIRILHPSQSRDAIQKDIVNGIMLSCNEILNRVVGDNQDEMKDIFPDFIDSFMSLRIDRGYDVEIGFHTSEEDTVLVMPDIIFQKMESYLDGVRG